MCVIESHKLYIPHCPAEPLRMTQDAAAKLMLTADTPPAAPTAAAPKTADPIPPAKRPRVSVIQG